MSDDFVEIAIDHYAQFLTGFGSMIVVVFILLRYLEKPLPENACLFWKRARKLMWVTIYIIMVSSSLIFVGLSNTKALRFLSKRYGTSSVYGVVIFVILFNLVNVTFLYLERWVLSRLFCAAADIPPPKLDQIKNNKNSHVLPN